jgi:formate--tetrahydrofolate ligase
MTDLEIARRATLRPIADIAAQLGIPEAELEPYGRTKAKLPLGLIDEAKVRQNKLILVSAINPTPAGEGKTTVSIGLAQALNRVGAPTTVVLREPSLGPVFGIKGGATGGGHSQVLPMEDINLHFTGDFSAVEKAHNLLAALLDNNLQDAKRSLGLDVRRIYWKRVMDMNDRALRNITVGLGGLAGGVPRETGFDITAASEVMAILCLSRDAQDLKDRLGRIFLGLTRDRNPVWASDLKAPGAMAILLKDALKPNLVQTLEGTPAIIHGGPFANIAQGTNTVIATKTGLSLSPYVVTEAGFGFDLGGEKFLHIKCRSAGLSPAAVVLVATVRALKYHGGAGLDTLTTENVAAVQRGLPNLQKHVENALAFGLRPIVAINRFATDTDAEVAAIAEGCRTLGVDVEPVTVWAEGGAGALELARKVRALADSPADPFRPLYNLDDPFTVKLTQLATQVYGASGIELAPEAETDLKLIERIGLGKLPLCVAKTQKSLSDTEGLLGRPSGFTLSVRRIEIAAGAGFLVPLTGQMMRMPGLPSVPASEGMDIDPNGVIVGLS